MATRKKRGDDFRAGKPAHRSRAESIRKVTPEEARGGACCGVWADETFPEDQIHKILEDAEIACDFSAFSTFLGERLGIYRSTNEHEETEPTKAQELELIDELIQVSQQMRVRFKNLAPMADAYLYSFIEKRTTAGYSEFERIFLQQLATLNSALIETERKIEAIDVPHGRRPKPHRDKLIYAVAGWLHAHAGTTKKKAAQVTAELLRRCRVQVPADLNECLRIIRRIDQGGNTDAT